MIAARSIALLTIMLTPAACSNGEGDGQSAATTTVPATVCVDTAAPEGRGVRVTIDDVVGGFGSLSLRADGGLTPGVVRIEVTAEPDNAAPLGVTVVFDGVVVATVAGVEPGATCGIDLTVSEGVYHVTDGDRDVEFTVEP
jgi:hypothetical protein